MTQAVVLLSGGLDSVTCLAEALSVGHTVTTLSFDYGQRHRAELAAAARIARHYGITDHRVITLDLAQLRGSALTDSAVRVPEHEPNAPRPDGIPVTYVPARNTVFLSFALAVAEVTGAEALYIGVNAIDYSGYPDCRPAFIDAFRTLAQLATKAGIEGRPLDVCTPLLHLSKREIIQRGVSLGVSYADTVSCYQADDEGRACGRCDACHLRREGFQEAAIPDPTRYVSPVS